MKLTDIDVALVLTLAEAHYGSLRGVNTPGAKKERVQTHALIKKFNKLDELGHARRLKRRRR